MRITLEHTFQAPVARVVAAVLEPGYQDRLAELPKLDERTVTEQVERPDGTIRRVVRYRFGESLPSAVTAVIGRSAVTWDEESVFDPSTNVWRFEIHPHVLQGKFQASGWYRFGPHEAGTIREFEAEVRVGIPLVGSRAERAIASGLVETMEEEARILAEYLDERSEAPR